MAPKLTMQKLAGRLGLSRSTISMVVNGTAGRKHISAATIQRVQEAMVAHGYVPSRQALHLKKGGRRGVGVLFCSPLFSHLLESFNHITALLTHDVTQTETLIVSRSRLTEAVRELLARGVDQLIWLHSQDSGREFQDPIILNYLDRFRQVIIYNYHFAPSDNAAKMVRRGYYLVGVDRIASYRAMARFIKHLGHRRVALALSAELQTAFAVAWHDAFVQAGLSPVLVKKEPAGSVAPESTPPGCAAELTAAVREHALTAACFSSDQSAAATLPGLAANGLRIPRDLTVTGWMGQEFTRFLQPALTTMEIPVKAMAQQVEAILNKNTLERSYCFPLQLIKGGSHTPYKATVNERLNPEQLVSE